MVCTCESQSQLNKYHSSKFFCFLFFLTAFDEDCTSATFFRVFWCYTPIHGTLQLYMFRLAMRHATALSLNHAVTDWQLETMQWNCCSMEKHNPILYGEAYVVPLCPDTWINFTINCMTMACTTRLATCYTISWHTSLHLICHCLFKHVPSVVIPDPFPHGLLWRVLYDLGGSTYSDSDQATQHSVINVLYISLPVSVVLFSVHWWDDQW